MAKTLATFRIDESLWDDFKQLMDKEGTNASAELVKFVLTRLGKLDDNLDNANTNNLDERIAEYLDNNLGASIDKIINSYLDRKLDKNIYNFLTRDEAVTPSQLDNRAASIIEKVDTAIAQLINRIEVLEAQVERNNSSQDALKGCQNEEKAQTAKEPKTPEKLGNTEDEVRQQILEFFKNHPNQGFAATQVKQHLNLEMETQTLGNMIGKIPQIKSEKKSENSKRGNVYTLNLEAETITNTAQNNSIT